MLIKFGIIALLACTSAVSTLLIRHGGRDLDFSQGILHVITQGYLWWGGIMLGWVCGLSCALLLTRWDVSVVVGLFTPLTYLLTLVAAAAILKEPWSMTRSMGVVLVIFGLVLLHEN